MSMGKFRLRNGRSIVLSWGGGSWDPGAEWLQVVEPVLKCTQMCTMYVVPPDWYWFLIVIIIWEEDSLKTRICTQLSPALGLWMDLVRSHSRRWGKNHWNVKLVKAFMGFRHVTELQASVASQSKIEWQNKFTFTALNIFHETRLLLLLDFKRSSFYIASDYVKCCLILALPGFDKQESRLAWLKAGIRPWNLHLSFTRRGLFSRIWTAK